MKTYDNKKEGKLRYDWLKSHGICTKCGCRDAMLGFTLCDECSYKQVILKREYQANLSPEKQSAINQRHYERAKRFTDAGLCKCGRERQDKQYKLCLECRLRARRYHKKYREKIQRKETGCCRYCGSKDVVEGKTLCAECLEKSRKTALENLSKANPDNSYFKRLNNAFWTEKR